MQCPHCGKTMLGQGRKWKCPKCGKEMILPRKRKGQFAEFRFYRDATADPGASDTCLSEATRQLCPE